MSPVVLLMLKLIASIPGDIALITSVWSTLKSAASAKDQATVDGVLAFLNPKVDADIAALHAAAVAASAGG